MTQLANSNQAIQIQIKKITLSKSEDAIMDLISSSLEKQEPITREDIFDSYKKTIHPTGITRSWTILKRKEDGRHQWGYGEVKIDDHYYGKTKALQWFKNNLSGCIIKGKLIVLPIIEI